MNFFVTTLVLFVLYLPWLRSEEIEYKLQVFTHRDILEKTLYSKEVVTNVENGFSITILNDFPVLRVGMLEIDPPTHHFIMTNHKLQEIEAGVFDNQNITGEIFLQSNNLIVIHSGTFKNVQIRSLDLCDNNIAHIEENAIIDMPNLSEVRLARNKIVQFHDNSFVYTPKMSSLYMSDNKLKKLGANWFNFMKKGDWVTVMVAYNDIKEINPEAFEGISVMHLALDHNKLKNIPEEIFKGNDLKFLYLGNNQLETLPEAFYEQKNLTEVDIRDNPLKCDVQNWLKAFNEKLGLFTPITFDDGFLRAYPGQQAATKPRGVVLYDSNC